MAIFSHAGSNIDEHKGISETISKK